MFYIFKLWCYFMSYEQKNTIPENVNFDLQENGNLTISCEGKNISRKD